MRMAFLVSDSGVGIPSNFSIPERAEDIDCGCSCAACRPCNRVSIRWIRRRSVSCDGCSLIDMSAQRDQTKMVIARRESGLDFRLACLRLGGDTFVGPALAVTARPRVVALRR